MNAATATLPSRKVYKAVQFGGTLYTNLNADSKAMADEAAGRSAFVAAAE